MSAVAVVLLEAFCCLGLGAAALRALGLDAGMSRGEQWTMGFAIGFGILGWLMFPLGVAGLVAPLPLTALLTAGAFGILLLKRPIGSSALPALDRVGITLVGLLAVALTFDLAEAVAPPTDADSLAYHYALPQRFLAAGRIEFVPEAIEGAVPLLVQLTYVPALGLGGELALTLWTMVSGWAPAALLFVLARRHLGLNWSLATALILLTLPAVVYGGGTGQVETRIALFVLVAAWGTARALQTGNARYAMLAGLSAGFFAASKYTGLLFVAAAGVVVVLQRRWLRVGAAFAAAAVAAGFQWYAWNALHTGDPVFPMLFQWLGRDDLAFWDQSQDHLFKEQYFTVENPLPRSPWWFVLYPFKATVAFAGLPDSGRVGFGPYGLLLMPFAMLGLWRFWDRVRRSPLLAYAGLTFLFYALWFFFGGSQRIRHLLPVLPLFLLCVTVSAERFTAGGIGRAPLLAAVAASLLLQAGGYGLHALKYVRFLAGGADREAFLMRNVEGYVAAPWINTHLTNADRILITRRQLRFFIRVPYLYEHPFYQSGAVLGSIADNADALYRHMRRAGITHVAATRAATDAPYETPFNVLGEAGCLTVLKRFGMTSAMSRTLPQLVTRSAILDVLALARDGCRR